MQDPNTPVICRTCQRTVPMREIKFDPNKKLYVCTTCFNGSTPAPQQKATEPAPQQSSTSSKNVKYNCTKCKYVFSKAEGKEVRECPYCGSKEVQPASKDAADKILDESEGWE